MTFGRLLGGANCRGEARLSMQILNNGESVPSRPCSPAGVRRILRASPSAPAPHSSSRLPFGRLGASILARQCTILAPRKHPGNDFGTLFLKAFRDLKIHGMFVLVLKALPHFSESKFNLLLYLFPKDRKFIQNNLNLLPYLELLKKVHSKQFKPFVLSFSKR